MKIIKGGVTAPKGFLSASLSCGIKKSGKDDLALLYSVKPCLCAGVFTANRVKSGSVALSKDRVRNNTAQSIIVNSGNANCCVGKKELEDAKSITSSLAESLKINKELILIASTGIIGKPLPVEKIHRKIALLVSQLSGNKPIGFAKAIMTTDTFPKEIAVNINAGGKKVAIGGAVKGSGMICPDMATMLAFFTTDAAIEMPALRSAFKIAAAGSFNKISIDGDMSTNDSAFILANGLAQNKVIKQGTKDYFRFLDALKFAAEKLAKEIVLDGEGATKFVDILVKGAKSLSDAEKIAKHVADSSLVKTMIAGGDPNWGRVAASVGSSGADIKHDKLDIYFSNKLVMKNGAGVNASKKVLSGIFRRKEIFILIDLKSGAYSSRMWTCDLTKKYVEINSEYET